jgi:hypothetical protein
MKISLRQFVILILILVSTSCGSSRKFIGGGKTYSYRCPSIVSYLNPEILDVSFVKNDSVLLSKYSYKSLEVANAFGLLEDLRVYENLRKSIRSEGRIAPEIFDEFANSYNRLNEGMNLAALEVKSIQDMLDCTILKLRKTKVQVSTSNLRKQNSLSNWAIGVGSATTVLTAGILISENDQLIGSTAFDWMAVAGGVLTGYLAFQSSRVNKKVNLNPENNFINVIWTGNNDADLFPISSWYLMNLDIEVNEEQTTLREIILKEWNDSEAMLAKEENKLSLPILLADEGTYTEEMIDLRIEMLEAIGLGVDQLNRSIYLFNAKRY